MTRSRAAPDDRTSRAIIRDAALALFAARGPDAVTVRQIAAAARVSPALVIRHFGSKDALREELDRHVVRLLDDALRETTPPDAPEWSDPAASASIVEVILGRLPPSSPVPRYLARMLLDGSRAGRQLFRRLFEMGRAGLERMVAAGQAAPGRDLAVRAAFLTANDLALLLLREPIADALGVDPLSREGMSRWAAELLAIYAAGLRAR